MKKIIIRSSVIIFLMHISCAKSKPNIYFDTTTQELVECSDFGLKNIYIDNDSTDDKGFLIEQQIQLRLKNHKNIPKRIDIQNIHSSYDIYKDGKRINKLVLMNNTRYTISHAVLGQTISDIKIWVNSKGYVYKVSKNNCDNSQ